MQESACPPPHLVILHLNFFQSWKQLSLEICALQVNIGPVMFVLACCSLLNILLIFFFWYVPVKTETSVQSLSAQFHFG